MNLARSFCVVATWLAIASLSASLAQAQAGRTQTGSSGLNSLGGGGGSSRTGNSFGGGTNPFSATSANQSVFQNQASSFGMQNPAQQQGGFLGANTGQNFLGANQRNQANNQQQQNQFGNRSNRNRFGQQGQNDFNGFGQQGQNNQDSRRAIRPQQKVAFEIPDRPTTTIHSDIQTRFSSLANSPTLRNVSCDLSGEGVATLRGEVDSASQKRLAENIVRLEPGVKKVVNELAVR